MVCQNSQIKLLFIGLIIGSVSIQFSTSVPDPNPIDLDPLNLFGLKNASSDSDDSNAKGTTENNKSNKDEEVDKNKYNNNNNNNKPGSHPSPVNSISSSAQQDKNFPSKQGGGKEAVFGAGASGLDKNNVYHNEGANNNPHNIEGIKLQGGNPKSQFGKAPFNAKKDGDESPDFHEQQAKPGMKPFRPQQPQHPTPPQRGGGPRPSNQFPKNDQQQHSQQQQKDAEEKKSEVDDETEDKKKEKF